MAIDREVAPERIRAEIEHLKAREAFYEGSGMPLMAQQAQWMRLRLDKRHSQLDRERKMVSVKRGTR